MLMVDNRRNTCADEKYEVLCFLEALSFKSSQVMGDAHTERFLFYFKRGNKILCTFFLHSIRLIHEGPCFLSELF